MLLRALNQTKIYSFTLQQSIRLSLSRDMNCNYSNAADPLCLH